MALVMKYIIETHQNLEEKKLTFKALLNQLVSKISHATSNSIPYFVNQIQALTRSLFH